MTSAANSQSSGQAGGAPWGSGPWWGDAPWQSGWAPPWARRGMSRPVAIVITLLGFLVWWPVGLAILCYMIGSGSMGCRSSRHRGNAAAAPWQGGGFWRSWCCGERAAPTSGNRAFDEYRTQTLQRLEEEQKEFAAFLDRLRVAKDKAEFDQFMAERRQPPAAPQPEAG